jgi:hypothetical protein
LKTFLDIALDRKPLPRGQHWLALERRNLMLLAGLCVAACSFQDFEYLQQGTGDSAGGSGGGGTAAGGSAGNSAGGTSGAGGSGGSAGPTGGSSAGGSASNETSTSSSGSSTTNNNPSANNTSGGGSSSTGAGGSSTTGEAGMGAGGEAGGPPAIVNLLTNGSFEESWTGWIVNPETSQGDHARVKWPQPGSVTPDGYTNQNLLGTWHETDAFVVTIYQSLDGLADGLYTFKGHFNWGNAPDGGGGHNSLTIFARNCGSTDLTDDIPPTGETQWVEFGISGIDVVGGHCEVGITIDSNAGDWLNADLFSMVEDPQ